LSITVHNILQLDNSVHFHGNTEHFYIFDSYVFVNNKKTTYCCVPMATMVMQTCHNIMYIHCLSNCLLIAIPDNQKEKFKSFVLIITDNCCRCVFVRHLWYGNTTFLVTISCRHYEKELLNKKKQNFWKKLSWWAISSMNTFFNFWESA
jgi:hypothetical protein